MLGDTLGNRVSAEAVGRRGRCPEGRSPLRFERCFPSGKRTERGREADPKAGVGIQGPGQRQIAGTDSASGISGVRGGR